MQVRQLTIADLADYRALHRYWTIESPTSTIDTAETDAARLDADVAAMLGRGEAWGVFDGERLMGKLAIDALPYPSLAHTFWVRGVYLHPDARGAGASTALLRAAIDGVRAKGASRVALWVSGENARAQHFYERLGFRETGRIPEGIFVNGKPYDDILMVLALD